MLCIICDDANERCPLFPGRVNRLHWPFEDPSRATGSDADRLETFQRVRDQIATQLQHWLNTEQS